jgi:hypothetical protein
MMRFVQLESGSWMPINMEPSPGGRVFVHEGVATKLSPRDAAQRREQGFPLYVPHPNTCPARRGGGREGRTREQSQGRQAARASFARAQLEAEHARQPRLW